MSQTAPINVALFAQTDVGKVRQGNEDNFLVVNLSTAHTWTAGDETEPPKDLLAFTQDYYGTVIAVSDGMGGALAGEVASNLAVHTVRDRLLEYQSQERYRRFPFSERLRLSVEQANSLIHSESIQNAQYSGMGATFTAAGIEGNVLYLAQIGDSRAYLIRNGRIQQMTRDQSLVGSLVEAGHITEEEAETHAYRNVILQALGATPTINVDVRAIRLRARDVVLLCSDGLSGKVRMQDMLEVVTKDKTLAEACKDLIDRANENGGEDNITVALVQFSGSGLDDQPDDDPDKEDKEKDDGKFEYETIPRDPELRAITQPLEEPDPTMSTTQPMERARAQPAKAQKNDTRQMRPAITQVLDRSQFPTDFTTPEPSSTEPIAVPPTQPLIPPPPPTERLSDYDLAVRQKQGQNSGEHLNGAEPGAAKQKPGVFSDGRIIAALVVGVVVLATIGFLAWHYRQYIPIPWHSSSPR